MLFITEPLTSAADFGWMKAVLCLLQIVALGVLGLVALMTWVIPVHASLDICDVMTRDGRVPPATLAPVVAWLWYTDVNGLMVCREKLREIKEKQHVGDRRTPKLAN